MRPTVVVTCTKRKRANVPSSLQLRNVRGRDLEERFAKWTARLDSMETRSLPATQLYAGEHWQIASALPVARLYVASAGYGLVSSSDELKPYGATFLAGDSDSIVEGIPNESHDSVREFWWSRLGSWVGPSKSQSRSLEELARRFPEAPLMVVASDPYLRACRTDLLKASKLLSSEDSLMIVSTGARLDRVLRKHLLPSDARLQHELGGTRQSLNIRIARFLLTSADELATNYSTASAALLSLLSRQPPIPRFDRTARSDDEVKQFIKNRLEVDPTLRAHPLLRLFRNDGFACEQSRFAALHVQVREEMGYA